MRVAPPVSLITLFALGDQVCPAHHLVRNSCKRPFCHTQAGVPEDGSTHQQSSKAQRASCRLARATFPGGSCRGAPLMQGSCRGALAHSTTQVGRSRPSIHPQHSAGVPVPGPGHPVSLASENPRVQLWLRGREVAGATSASTRWHLKGSREKAAQSGECSGECNIEASTPDPPSPPHPPTPSSSPPPSPCPLSAHGNRENHGGRACQGMDFAHGEPHGGADIAAGLGHLPGVCGPRRNLRGSRPRILGFFPCCECSQ